MDMNTEAGPLEAAIDRAVDVHPAVTTAPKALRSARRASMKATAEAMAEFRGALAPEDVCTTQLVEDAATSLRLVRQEDGSMYLDATPGERHDALAKSLAHMPIASDLGMDDGPTIARLEEAMARILVIRASDVGESGIGERSMVADILSTIMRVAGSRGTKLSDMEDHDMIRIVEDSLDDLLCEVRATD